MFKSLVKFLYRGFFPEPTPEPTITETVDKNENTTQFTVLRKDITQLTLVLDNEVASILEGLAVDMQTNVHDVLIRMIKIANIIRVEKLYGIPSVSGNYLGVSNHKTNEFFRINMDCPTKGKEPKEELPSKIDTKKWAN